MSYPDRTVSTEEGKMLAAKYNLPFIETSAQEDINIRELFLMLGRLVLQSNDHKKDQGIDIGRSHLTKDADEPNEKRCC